MGAPSTGLSGLGSLMQNNPASSGAGSPAVQPGQTNHPAPGGKSGMAQVNPYQPTGGQSDNQPIPQGQIPGSKGFGQPTMQGMSQPMMNAMQGAGQQQPAPGSKGSAPGQKGMPSQSDLQRAAIQGGKGAGQPMQPFHNALSNDYNVQGGQRASSPYAPPGTSGGTAAFGMGPANAGFGFGNGAARVPDTQHLTAGQVNPNSYG